MLIHSGLAFSGPRLTGVSIFPGRLRIFWLCSHRLRHLMLPIAQPIPRRPQARSGDSRRRSTRSPGPMPSRPRSQPCLLRVLSTSARKPKTAARSGPTLRGEFASKRFLLRPSRPKSASHSVQPAEVRYTCLQRLPHPRARLDRAQCCSYLNTCRALAISAYPLQGRVLQSFAQRSVILGQTSQQEWESKTHGGWPNAAGFATVTFSERFQGFLSERFERRIETSCTQFLKTALASIGSAKATW